MGSYPIGPTSANPTNAAPSNSSLRKAWLRKEAQNEPFEKETHRHFTVGSSGPTIIVRFSMQVMASMLSMRIRNPRAQSRGISEQSCRALECRSLPLNPDFPVKDSTSVRQDGDRIPASIRFCSLSSFWLHLRNRSAKTLAFASVQIPFDHAQCRLGEAE